MRSFVEVFDKVTEYFQQKVDRGELDEVAFKLWIKALKPVSLDENTAVFNVQTEFQKSIILKNYKKLLEDAFTEILGHNAEINIISVENESEGVGIL